MKKRKILIILPALALSLIFGANRALAYFTSYAVAKGAYEVSLKYETTIDEPVVNNVKQIKITASADSQPVYVRVQAFCGSQWKINYNGTNWEKRDDGWYYYAYPLNAGESTEILYAGITGPENAEAGDVGNVIVVWECTPVLYDEDDEPYADWTFKLDADETTSNGTSGQTPGGDSDEPESDTTK